MTTALLVAILNATPALVLALEKLFAAFHAAGHPDDAPHTPDQIAQIEAVVARHDPSYEVRIAGAQTWDNPDGGE